jgi:hypothetical protein
MKFWRGRSKRVPAEQRQAGPADEAPTIDLLARADVTRETFFLLYARLIEEELGAVNLRFIEDGVLTFEAPSGKTKTTFMENAWLQCKSANEPRVEIIQRYLRTLRAIDEEPDCSREQIIAIVKDSEYVSSLGKDTPLKHLAADLWIVYALDLPESTRSLSAEQMTQLGVEAQEVVPVQA